MGPNIRCWMWWALWSGRTHGGRQSVYRAAVPWHACAYTYRSACRDTYLTPTMAHIVTLTVLRASSSWRRSSRSTWGPCYTRSSQA